MAKKHHERNPESTNKKAISYVVDTQPGNHSYVFVEGVGECRKHFMEMVEALDKGEADVLIVFKLKLLYVDTSPLWIEKFIATVKRRGVLIADASTNQEYDLRQAEDEAAFRNIKNG